MKHSLGESLYPIQVLEGLVAALRFWEARGATVIDLPWIVPSVITDITKPAGSTDSDITTKYGNLVASGEQSFLELVSAGKIKAGLKVGWTPCFRDESTIDWFHKFYFMKVELFHAGCSDYRDLLQGSLDFFKCLHEKMCIHLDAKIPTYFEIIQESETQQDIYLNGLEIGSYGTRRVLLPNKSEPFLYSYGTAIAYPRFLHALGIS